MFSHDTWSGTGDKYLRFLQHVRSGKSGVIVCDTMCIAELTIPCMVMCTADAKDTIVKGKSVNGNENTRTSYVRP